MKTRLLVGLIAVACLLAVTPPIHAQPSPQPFLLGSTIVALNQDERAASRLSVTITGDDTLICFAYASAVVFDSRPFLPRSVISAHYGMCFQTKPFVIGNAMGTGKIISDQLARESWRVRGTDKDSCWPMPCRFPVRARLLVGETVCRTAVPRRSPSGCTRFAATTEIDPAAFELELPEPPEQEDECRVRSRERKRKSPSRAIVCNAAITCSLARSPQPPYNVFCKGRVTSSVKKQLASYSSKPRIRGFASNSYANFVRHCSKASIILTPFSVETTLTPSLCSFAPTRIGP